MSVKPQLLRRCPPFSSLQASDLESLARLSTMRWVDRSDRLCRQGDPAPLVHCLLDGAIKLSRVTPSGRIMVTDFLGPGELVGERALLGDEQHPDEATALEDSLVALIPTDPAVRFLEVRPEALMALARQLAERLVAQERKIAGLSTQRVHQRLAEGLLRLGRTLGVRSDGHVVVNARLTQAEIADWIGTTRETASTLLNELRRAGVIDIVSRRIHLLDPEALRLWRESEEPDPPLEERRERHAQVAS